MQCSIKYKNLHYGNIIKVKILQAQHLKNYSSHRFLCPYTVKIEVLTINSNGKSCIFRDEGYERVMGSVRKITGNLILWMKPQVMYSIVHVVTEKVIFIQKGCSGIIQRETHSLRYIMGSANILFLFVVSNFSSFFLTRSSLLGSISS